MHRAKLARQKQKFLESFRASGLSVKQWCEKSGVSRSSAYRWLREETEVKDTNVTSSIIEEEKSKSQPKAAERVKWLPVTERAEIQYVAQGKNQLASDDSEGVEKIQIQIGNFTIITPDGFGRDTFKSVCKTLIELC
jgi:transposase